MTYTIVARDPATGQFGVAVQTCNLAVGAWVPWAEGGVGAVATQARAERTYGTLGLDLMRGGKSAPAALTSLLASDEHAAVRQVAMIDTHGEIAIHTGERCFPMAGSTTGDGFCTLANMMAQDTVWDAMAQAYAAAEGDFASRLMAALHAAQAEGGDMRGKQTAALLIVDSQRSAIPLINLRVDYDPDPLTKLDAMLHRNRAFMAEYTVSDLVAAGKPDEARAALDLMKQHAPDEGYLMYLRALHLAAELDDWDTAIPELRALFERDPVWRDYLAREATVDNFGIPGLGKRLLEALK